MNKALPILRKNRKSIKILIPKVGNSLKYFFLFRENGKIGYLKGSPGHKKIVLQNKEIVKIVDIAKVDIVEFVKSIVKNVIDQTTAKINLVECTRNVLPEKFRPNKTIYKISSCC